MRAIQVQVRSESVGAVLALAAEHRAHSSTAVAAECIHRQGRSEPGEWSLVFLTVPNDAAGAFIEAVREAVEDAEFLLLPLGALPIQTPLDRLGEQVRDVSRLSTLELVAASLQSVGSWRGMLLFSLLAGVIGAYGLIFDTAYLLVAAMLINPMGAPAQVAVIAISVGDARMFGRGALRFTVSLAVQVLAALALGTGYALSVATVTMEQVAALSNWAVLVALAAGAAGAQTQVKSERDSLVSGTAAGFMVAAALAPPAAVLGLAIPLGRWDHVGTMLFLLALQFLAITTGGALVLHAFGVRPKQPSIGRGAAWMRTALAVAVLTGTVGLVAWQTTRHPEFQKADLSRTALEIAHDAAARVPGAYLLDASARFRSGGVGSTRQILILDLTLGRPPDAPTDEMLASRVREEVQRGVAVRMKGVTPFVGVDVIRAPSSEIRP